MNNGIPTAGTQVTQGNVFQRAWYDFLSNLGLLATQIRNGNYPTGTISLKAYTVADLPADPADGLMVFCTDDVGGAVPVFSFGGQWLRVTDRAVAS